METILDIERVGKRYYVGHREAVHHASVRDALSGSARALGRRLLHPLQASSGQPLPGETGTEEFWALKDVSFSIARGERVGIIGRNGAGKSTLLKILSRITEPTTGRVRIRGRTTSLLEVGTGFHPELTGSENIFLNGAIMGMRKAEIRRKFDEIVAFAEVERFLDTPVKRYSSGMYVRLAFAVAAHLEPEILIVDEVLAVGDAQFQKKCIGKMEEVSSGHGRTILFVSHNMAAVQRLCNRCVLLREGMVTHNGSVNEVVGEYLAAGEPKLRWQRGDDRPITDTCLLEVAAIDSHGNLLSHVETAGSLRILVSFEIVLPDRNLQLSLGLLDDYGSQIFGSSPLDCGVDLPKKAGRYSAIIELPKDLLLAKNYGVRVVLWAPGRGIIDGGDKLRFTAQETESLANRSPGGRTGQVALQCMWKIE